jgi:hypothetical protein
MVRPKNDNTRANNVEITPRWFDFPLSYTAADVIRRRRPLTEFHAEFSFLKAEHSAEDAGVTHGMSALGQKRIFKRRD